MFCLNNSSPIASNSSVKTSLRACCSAINIFNHSIRKLGSEGRKTRQSEAVFARGVAWEPKVPPLPESLVLAEGTRERCT